MKVHQDDASRRLAHDVLRFQVPVQQPRVVHRLQGIADRHDNSHHLGRGQWASAPHEAVESAALDELHPQSGASVVLLGAVDRDDIGMTKAREDPALMQHGGRRPGLASMNELERDLAIEALVPGTVDAA